MDILIFIKKCSGYLAFSLLGIIIVCLSVNSFMAKTGYFRLEPNIKSVVIGDSHPECALNDYLISDFKNLGQYGESYFYTFIKTKQILRDNPLIETIFIEYSNNSIASSIDQQIWSNKYINFRYPNYSAHMDIEERMLLIKRNLKAVIIATPITLKKQILRMINNNYNYVETTGGYSYETKNNIEFKLIKPLIFDKAKMVEINTVAIYNLYYLDKIIALCKERNVEIYLMRSPLHRNSLYLTNENLFQSIKKKKFPDIEFLDFKDFPLTDDDFRDFDHLNYRGAKKFSLWFNRLLKNKVLKKQDK